MTPPPERVRPHHIMGTPYGGPLPHDISSYLGYLKRGLVLAYTILLNEVGMQEYREARPRRAAHSGSGSVVSQVADDRTR